LLLNSYQITKLANHKTCLVILIILNLPLKIQYNNENILLSLLILSPRKYKDLNTFLFPLIKELYILVNSVTDVKNDFTKESFNLKAHLILVFINRLAFINTIGLKRLGNAIRPYYYYIILKVNSANKEGKSHYYMLYKDI
jgi:membrane-associated phospholipid phosphatase